ncbi:MAG: RNA-guided pseudouridylation complex pseudouridine synthase subunit Cbf5 [Candidatus Bathyarchaeota archaeon]|nr:MAG: RNA-guided pseudouridylation complex pseudouridine synthase subunit Cbf5 [Candidatus Bathyarchaeota archaeon]
MFPWEAKRELVIKAEEETSPDYGYIPLERPLQEYINFGMVNLDKPPGPSSHEVAAWTKRLLQLQRIGHGGTLDPRVTGILPIVLQDAIKITQALLQSSKEYICVTRLHSAVSENRIKAVLSEFVGAIYQRPPIRASVKRRLRTRTIYYLRLLEVNDRNVLFQVGCEAGTYIRKLSHDIGEALGCGAHMQELRRTRSGSLTEDSNLVTLQDMSFYLAQYRDTQDEKHLRRFIQPMENALQLLPKIIIRDSAVSAICHGANLTAPGVLALETGIDSDDTVVISTQKEEAVSLAVALASTESILKKDHGFVARTTRVLMPRGIYPKRWRLHR